MTSLVHIGDFHAAPGPRNADRYRALDQIIREGSALERLGAWLWPGDLFDAASTAEDRNALDERLRQMAERAPVLICYGNHDRPGDLDGFANLASAWPITVVDRPGCVRLHLATMEWATVFVLPYPHKQRLVAAGVAVGDVVDVAGDLLEPIFIQAAAELEAARQAGDVTLAIGHINIAGALTSTGQPNIGREIELNPKHLQRLGPVYIGLNHIHRAQEIHGAFYAGSCARQDYGEIEEKSWIEVALSRDASWGGFAGDGPWNGSPEHGVFDLRRHPIEVAPMFHIDGVLGPLGFAVDSFDESNDEEIHRRLGAAGRGWKGCDVRVRYRYQASEKPVLDEQCIRDLFAGALRLKIESVAIPDRDLRAPEVAQAVTLEAKLAAYRQEAELPPTLAAKLQLLEQCDAAGVLADVAEQLARLERGQEVTVAA